jgi:16S rRNA processing protein RimM
MVGAAVPGGGSAPETPDDLIDLGAVRGAYGVKGWARIEPYDRQADVLRKTVAWWICRDSQRHPVEIEAIKQHGALILAKWRGFEVPEAVDRIRGATVAVPRSLFPALAAGEYYWVDLIGLDVVNREHRVLGRVAAMASNGAQDLLQVEGGCGVLLVPMVPAYVDEVDLASRRVRVDWQPDWS